ncbi:unnamed protein product, partial [Hapterophycus canaliculatus]
MVGAFLASESIFGVGHSLFSFCDAVEPFIRGSSPSLVACFSSAVCLAPGFFLHAYQFSLVYQHFDEAVGVIALDRIMMGLPCRVAFNMKKVGRDLLVALLRDVFRFSLLFSYVQRKGASERFKGLDADGHLADGHLRRHSSRSSLGKMERCS